MMNAEQECAFCYYIPKIFVTQSKIERYPSMA